MKQKQLPHVQDDWQGYTMDEMMYQKAFLLARMEVSKAKLVNRVSEFKTGFPECHQVRYGARCSMGFHMWTMLYLPLS